MLIGLSLFVIIILGFLSIMLGSEYLANTINVGIDNTSLVNGSITTYVVETETVLFEIDTSVFIVAGIALLITVAIVAGITGIQVLGSGLNSESVKIIIMITAFTGIWITLSIIAINLISSIAIFGSIIYIGLTLMYVIGVVQKLTGGGG